MTWETLKSSMEAPVGFEPTIFPCEGIALPTWLRGLIAQCVAYTNGDNTEVLRGRVSRQENARPCFSILPNRSQAGGEVILDSKIRTYARRSRYFSRLPTIAVFLSNPG